MEFYRGYPLKRDGVLHGLTSKMILDFTYSNLEPSWDFIWSNLKPSKLLHQDELRNQGEILYMIISNQWIFYIRLSSTTIVEILMVHLHELKDFFWCWKNSQIKQRLPLTIPNPTRAFTCLDHNQKNHYKIILYSRDKKVLVY